MKRFMKLPSPAMVVASAALFVALGGTSYAVATGSIDSREIRNGTIVEKDIKSQGIEGSDIKNGALAARDIKPGSLTGASLAPGVAGKTSRWALVNRGGQIEAQSGGFSVTSAYPAGGGNGNVYINAGEDLSDNGISATIALENGYDIDGDGYQSGTSSTRADQQPASSPVRSRHRDAQIPGIVECGPTAAKNTNNLVVSPRNSDGTLTSGQNRQEVLRDRHRLTPATDRTGRHRG